MGCKVEINLMVRSNLLTSRTSHPIPRQGHPPHVSKPWHQRPVLVLHAEHVQGGRVVVGADHVDVRGLSAAGAPLVASADVKDGHLKIIKIIKIIKTIKIKDGHLL